MITKSTYIQKKDLGRLNTILEALGYKPTTANFAMNIMNEYQANINNYEFERIFWLVENYGIAELKSFNLTDRIFAASACYEHPQVRYQVLDNAD